MVEARSAATPAKVIGAAPKAAPELAGGAIGVISVVVDAVEALARPIRSSARFLWGRCME